MRVVLVQLLVASLDHTDLFVICDVSIVNFDVSSDSSSFACILLFGSIISSFVSSDGISCVDVCSASRDMVGFVICCLSEKSGDVFPVGICSASRDIVVFVGDINDSHDNVESIWT